MNHQEPAGPDQGLEKERTLLVNLEWIMAGAAQHGHAEERVETAYLFRMRSLA